MADSIMSITVRDAHHPCAPYQSSKHSFLVSIYHCDGKALWWKGVDYSSPGVRLTEKGHSGGYIHGQFKVPPGCYLVQAMAPCENVFTDWAYVGVGCDETVCVNLVPSSIDKCIKRMATALELGTVAPKGMKERPLAELMPKEVRDAINILQKIADNIPEDTNLPELPTVSEIKKAMAEPKSRK